MSRQTLRKSKSLTSTPMTAATHERLVALLEARYGAANVWRVVEVCPVSVVKVIDNEEDALVTCMNFEAAAKLTE